MTGPDGGVWAAAAAADTVARVLDHPDAEVQLRGHRSVLRIARRAGRTVRELRRGGGVTVGLLTDTAGPDWLLRATAPATGATARACPALSVSVPTAVLLAAGCRGPDVGGALRAAGCDPRDAARLAHALAVATSGVEITFHGPCGRTPSVLALLDGPDGAVLAHTAPAADGAAWTAVCEGSPHRLRAALRRGCEDLPGGWLP